MNNPFYKSKPLKEKDCYSCEDISSIEKKNEIRSEKIAEKYTRNRIPIIISSDIVSDEMKSWPICNPGFGLDDIQQVIYIIDHRMSNKLIYHKIYDEND